MLERWPPGSTAMQIAQEPWGGPPAILARTVGA